MVPPGTLDRPGPAPGTTVSSWLTAGLTAARPAAASRAPRSAALGRLGRPPGPPRWPGERDLRLPRALADHAQLSYSQPANQGVKRMFRDKSIARQPRSASTAGNALVSVGRERDGWRLISAIRSLTRPTTRPRLTSRSATTGQPADSFRAADQVSHIFRYRSAGRCDATTSSRCSTSMSPVSGVSRTR